MKRAGGMGELVINNRVSNLPLFSIHSTGFLQVQFPGKNYPKLVKSGTDLNANNERNS